MGNKNSAGQETQKMLEQQYKEVDYLNAKVNALQMIILEEMQNPNLMPNLLNNFSNKYREYLNKSISKLNDSNKSYLDPVNHVNIINIVFDFETHKVNVVSPTDFNLKNIYVIALNKLNDKTPYSDIKKLLFRYNAQDISNLFDEFRNSQLKEANIPDQGVIEVIRKNNVTINGETAY